MIYRICQQKQGQLNNDERLELCRLLVKAGYTVRISRVKENSKPAAVIYVEYAEPEAAGEMMK